MINFHNSHTQNENLIILSNTTDPPQQQQQNQCFGSFGGATFGAANQSMSCNPMGAPGAFQTARFGGPPMGFGCSSSSIANPIVPKIRKKFPETWIWESINDQKYFQ